MKRVIRFDSGSDGVFLFLSRTTEDRGSFADEDLQKSEGLNDFFSAGRAYCDLEPGRARTLAAAFREGRWRQTLA